MTDNQKLTAREDAERIFAIDAQYDVDAMELRGKMIVEALPIVDGCYQDGISIGLDDGRWIRFRADCCCCGYFIMEEKT